SASAADSHYFDLANGQFCGARDSWCASGFCNQSNVQNNSGHCHAKQPNGQWCRQDINCQSDNCGYYPGESQPRCLAQGQPSDDSLPPSGHLLTGGEFCGARDEWCVSGFCNQSDVTSNSGHCADKQ